MILAGGLGTRVRSISESLPKALLPVRGRPFAEVQLQWLAGEGIGRVIYSIGFKGELIREALGTGSRFGMAIDYVDEGEDLRGTGGALRLALDAGLLPERFFVLYGDSYLDVAFRDVERSWIASGLPAIMTVLRNLGRWDRSNATLQDGRVLYDKGAQETGVAMDWIDYGLSATRSDVIDEWLSPGQRGDLADLFHRLSIGGELAGFEVTNRFYEIGSPTGLQELEEYLAESGQARSPRR